MICIPIRKKSLNTILSNLRKAEKLADLTEVWFDEFQNLTDKDVAQVFKSKRKPIIYKYTGNQDTFEKVLSQKPDFIDIDISSDSRLIKRIKALSPKTKIIISSHNFKETPSSPDLKKLVHKMYKKGATIAKLATHAKDITDSIRVLSLLSFVAQNGQKVIMICMGKQGQITRAAGHLLGNYLMYAPLNMKDKTAPGQILAKELMKIQSCH